MSTIGNSLHIEKEVQNPIHIKQVNGPYYSSLWRIAHSSTIFIHLVFSLSTFGMHLG